MQVFTTTGARPLTLNTTIPEYQILILLCPPPPHTHTYQGLDISSSNSKSCLPFVWRWPLLSRVYLQLWPCSFSSCVGALWASLTARWRPVVGRRRPASPADWGQTPGTHSGRCGSPSLKHKNRAFNNLVLSQKLFLYCSFRPRHSREIQSDRDNPTIKDGIGHYFSRCTKDSFSDIRIYAGMRCRSKDLFLDFLYFLLTNNYYWFIPM